MQTSYERKNFLTIDDFIELSFKVEELEELVSKGLIESKENFYTYKSLREIINFYFSLIREGRREYAEKCLKLCYMIDPYTLVTNYELFTNSIKNCEFEESTVYLKFLIENANDEYRSDYLCYLYLLSTFIDIKEENLKAYACTINSRDLMVQDNREDIHDLSVENKMRKFIYAQKFVKALSVLRGECKSNYNKKREFHIRYTLISKAIDMQCSFKECLKGLLMEKKYLDCYLLLKNEYKKRQLSLIEKYTILALEDLISIMYTKKMPVRIKQSQTNDKPKNIFDLIYGGNYREVFLMSSELSNIKESLIYTLILAINQEMEHLIDNSINEMIYNVSDEEPVPIEKIFYQLYQNGISTNVLYKMLRLSCKQQFICLLYSARMFYAAGNLDDGDRLLDEASALNYRNPRQIEALSKQRSELLDKCFTENLERTNNDGRILK